MVREHINAEDSYVPPWHFNQAVKVTDGASKIFRDAPAEYQTDGGLAESDVVSQAEAALENMAKVARAAGGVLADVVKTTVYTREDFREHSDAAQGGSVLLHCPSSTLTQVVGFANPDYLSQIEATAVINRLLSLRLGSRLWCIQHSV